MAENDGRARTSAAGSDVLQAPGAVKADPIAKTRLPEEDARATFYGTVPQKDTLPEHEARRTALPHINAST